MRRRTTKRCARALAGAGTALLLAVGAASPAGGRPAHHTFAVRVQAFQGMYRVGTAQAVTFADVEVGGVFSGVDDG